MRFYIFQDDYEGYTDNSIEKRIDQSKVNIATSVISYKCWFFECIRNLGEIIPLENGLEKKRLNAFLDKPETIFLSFNIPPPPSFCSNIRHRLLQLSLDSLLLPNTFYVSKCLSTSQVQLVSTQFQLERLKIIFGNLLPKMNVFSPNIDTDFYFPPDKNQRIMARKKEGIKEKQVHIVYAGRWIVTKGICQLIRALDIWPMPNLILTLVGSIEEQNRLTFSFADHQTFTNFLDEEIFLRKQRTWLRFRQAKNNNELREIFWSADLFVNPSIQPDENFGITPREALSCGIPVLTTNFCGLHPLTEIMPWKGINTYPTLVGSRFSLRQLRILLQRAIMKRESVSAKFCHKSILDESSQKAAMRNLKEAVDYLRTRPPQIQKDKDLEIYKTKIKKRILNLIDNRMFKYYIDTRKKFPSGAYIFGDRPTHYDFPLIQGIYSAKSTPPEVEKNSKWRGFFRIGLWNKEKALLEFGFPGPRILRYQKKVWPALAKCSQSDKLGEYLFTPQNNEQVDLIQELVDLGYLVPEDY